MKRSIRSTLTGTLLLSAVVGAPAAAGAQPSQWTSASGGNGHWYQVFNSLNNWLGSNTSAGQLSWNGEQGYLVSITSAAENDFVQSLISEECLPDAFQHPCFGYWIGAYQDPAASDYSEPLGGWRWTSGENFDYANWASGEPNNTLTGRNDNWAVMYNENSIWGPSAGKWNDDYLTGGFIVEFGSPTPVPEPGSGLLLSIGAACLAAMAKRRRRSH